ncbi:hypothetical protein C0J52_24916 [Blattella germanica]|nr:hypothetical protein C0J52_24916 [Blattella germanica]
MAPSEETNGGTTCTQQEKQDRPKLQDGASAQTENVQTDDDEDSTDVLKEANDLQITRWGIVYLPFLTKAHELEDRNKKLSKHLIGKVPAAAKGMCHYRMGEFIPRRREDYPHYVPENGVEEDDDDVRQKCLFLLNELVSRTEEANRQRHRDSSQQMEGGPVQCRLPLTKVSLALQAYINRASPPDSCSHSPNVFQGQKTVTVAPPLPNLSDESSEESPSGETAVTPFTPSSTKLPGSPSIASVTPCPAADKPRDSSTAKVGPLPRLFLFQVEEVHQVSDDDGQKWFMCDICLSRYQHCFSLKRHYLRSHINHRYLTDRDISNCGIIVEDRVARERSVVIKNSNSFFPNLYRCNRCVVFFDEVDELKDHLNLHPEEANLSQGKSSSSNSDELSGIGNTDSLQHSPDICNISTEEPCTIAAVPSAGANMLAVINCKSPEHQPSTSDSLSELSPSGHSPKSLTVSHASKHISPSSKLHDLEFPKPKMVPQLLCQYCEKSFSTVTMHKRHMSRSHPQQCNSHLSSQDKTLHHKCTFCTKPGGMLEQHTLASHPCISCEESINVSHQESEWDKSVSDLHNHMDQDSKEVKTVTNPHGNVTCANIEHKEIDQVVGTVKELQNSSHQTEHTCYTEPEKEDVSSREDSDVQIEDKSSQEHLQESGTSDSLKYTCSICHKVFDDYVAMCRHHRKVHKGKRTLNSLFGGVRSPSTGSDSRSQSPSVLSDSAQEVSKKIVAFSFSNESVGETNVKSIETSKPAEEKQKPIVMKIKRVAPKIINKDCRGEDSGKETREKCTKNVIIPNEINQKSTEKLIPNKFRGKICRNSSESVQPGEEVSSKSVKMNMEISISESVNKLDSNKSSFDITCNKSVDNTLGNAYEECKKSFNKSTLNEHKEDLHNEFIEKEVVTNPQEHIYNSAESNVVGSSCAESCNKTIDKNISNVNIKELEESSTVKNMITKVTNEKRMKSKEITSPIKLECKKTSVDVQCESAQVVCKNSSGENATVKSSEGTKKCIDIVSSEIAELNRIHVKDIIPSKLTKLVCEKPIENNSVNKNCHLPKKLLGKNTSTNESTDLRKQCLEKSATEKPSEETNISTDTDIPLGTFKKHTENHMFNNSVVKQSTLLENKTSNMSTDIHNKIIDKSSKQMQEVCKEPNVNDDSRRSAEETHMKIIDSGPDNSIEKVLVKQIETSVHLKPEESENIALKNNRSQTSEETRKTFVDKNIRDCEEKGKKSSKSLNKFKLNAGHNEHSADNIHKNFKEDELQIDLCESDKKSFEQNEDGEANEVRKKSAEENIDKLNKECNKLVEMNIPNSPHEGICRKPLVKTSEEIYKFEKNNSPIKHDEFSMEQNVEKKLCDELCRKDKEQIDESKPIEINKSTKKSVEKKLTEAAKKKTPKKTSETKSSKIIQQKSRKSDKRKTTREIKTKSVESEVSVKIREVQEFVDTNILSNASQPYVVEICEKGKSTDKEIHQEEILNDAKLDDTCAQNSNYPLKSKSEQENSSESVISENEPKDENCSKSDCHKSEEVAIENSQLLSAKISDLEGKNGSVQSETCSIFVQDTSGVQASAKVSNTETDLTTRAVLGKKPGPQKEKIDTILDSSRKKGMSSIDEVLESVVKKYSSGYESSNSIKFSTKSSIDETLDSVVMNCSEKETDKCSIDEILDFVVNDYNHIDDSSSAKNNKSSIDETLEYVIKNFQPSFQKVGKLPTKKLPIKNIFKTDAAFGISKKLLKRGQKTSLRGKVVKQILNRKSKLLRKIPAVGQTLNIESENSAFDNTSTSSTETLKQAKKNLKQISGNGELSEGKSVDLPNELKSKRKNSKSTAVKEILVMLTGNKNRKKLLGGKKCVKDATEFSTNDTSKFLKKNRKILQAVNKASSLEKLNSSSEESKSNSFVEDKDCKLMFEEMRVPVKKNRNRSHSTGDTSESGMLTMCDLQNYSKKISGKLKTTKKTHISSDIKEGIENSTKKSPKPRSQVNVAETNILVNDTQENYISIGCNSEFLDPRTKLSDAGRVLRSSFTSVTPEANSAQVFDRKGRVLRSSTAPVLPKLTDSLDSDANHALRKITKNEEPTSTIPTEAEGPNDCDQSSKQKSKIPSQGIRLRKFSRRVRGDPVQEDQHLDPETLFYCRIAGNIQENLLHHLDGKLEVEAANNDSKEASHPPAEPSTLQEDKPHHHHKVYSNFLPARTNLGDICLSSYVFD